NHERIEPQTSSAVTGRHGGRIAILGVLHSNRSIASSPVGPTVTVTAPSRSVRMTVAPAACQRATTAGAGKPNGLPRPHEITARRGRVWATRRVVDEVGLPWWAT